MTTFSEKLTVFLAERKITIAQLAQICKIDRSTMYQYLKGKRPVKSLDVLEKIIEPLCLTQEERADVLEAYDVEQLGAVRYQQYREIEKFLFSLSDISVSREKSKWEIVNTSLVMNSEVQNVIQGELNIKRAIVSLMRKAEGQDSYVKVIFSPRYSKMLAEILLMEQYSKLKIFQIFCFDGVQTNLKEHNLDMLRSVFQCHISLPNYRSSYYYGSAEERFGESQLFPNILVTEEVVIQFSADGKNALVHTETEIVEVFHALMKRIEKTCRPLMSYWPNLFEEINWADNYINAFPFQHSYELSSGTCSIQFWNRELIQRYMNPDIPGYDGMVEMLVAYAANLRRKKSAGHTTILMNPSYVEEFVQTGVFREYPSNFIRGALTKKDRRYLFEEMLAACREGWYGIRFIEPEKFPLNFQWEIGTPEETHAMIQYFHDDTFSVCILSELSCSWAIYNYLEILANGRHAMSQEESENLVRYWIQKYLSE
ncbi:helix-turn-helix domain-containing protein [Faecalicatena contorta]|uniref:helix-turn-helix domain-containing protein n=1 Tax=Faecalicatena contorta TaxID=39482 RepID=UPI001F225CE9|nr:XRE family transcriptional regulator [Faecalicatena contorta]MCF2683678.1 XRE family transcriptional regulator [Faecalicatena contorta]